MISLFLDSSNTNMVVGIYRDTETLYLKVEQCNHDLSERLLPSIQEAFKKVGIPISKLDRIYVVNGPGSFTGVRIGCTVAKTIAWALQKEIVPISELELLASTDTCGKSKIALIDARRECVYAGAYDNDLNPMMEDAYISLNDLFQKKDNEAIMISNDIFDFETMIPKVDIKRIIEKHQFDAPINPHQLNPNYLKRTEAEEKYGATGR